MIYPDTDPKVFAFKHGISPTQHPCYSCKRIVDVNIPVISKDFVGFESDIHEPCGASYRISHLKPRDPTIMALVTGDE